MYTKFRSAALSALLSASSLSALAQGSAFTYQGRLNDNGAPANGWYDVRFALFDAALNGNCIAGPLTNYSVATSTGLFTASLDFGLRAFDGTPRWLEVAVRTNGGDSFVVLTPRQPLAPNPYALYAQSAGTAAAVAATNLLGTIPLGQLSSPVLTNGQAGVNLSGAFAGDGRSLTNLGVPGVPQPVLTQASPVLSVDVTRLLECTTGVFSGITGVYSNQDFVIDGFHYPGYTNAGGWTMFPDLDSDYDDLIWSNAAGTTLYTIATAGIDATNWTLLPYGEAVGQPLPLLRTDYLYHTNYDTQSVVSATVLRGALDWSNIVNGVNSPGLLLDYPHVGPARTQAHKNSLDPPGAILYLGAGVSGIVRNFWFVPAGDSALTPGSLPNLNLRVYVDAGAIDDVKSNPPPASLVVDAPLNVLLGRVYRPSPNGIRETRFLDATESDATWQSFFVKFPMPFTNGVLITIWNKALARACVEGFSYASYEIGPLGPFANWRFRAQYASASRQLGSVTILQVNQPGMVVGICQSLLGPSPPYWLEGPLQFTTDNGAWAASGGEDIFLNPGYFSYGTNTQQYYGTLYTNLLSGTNFVVEAYRWWDRDAICWTNHASATVPLGVLGTVGQSADVLTFYYSP